MLSPSCAPPAASTATTPADISTTGPRTRHVRHLQRPRRIRPQHHHPRHLLLHVVPVSRSAVRMGALQPLQVIHAATHDSIGMGEDGPTHQPVELASLYRAHAESAVHPPRRHRRNRRAHG
jgi:hypothetical protein